MINLQHLIHTSLDLAWNLSHGRAYGRLYSTLHARRLAFNPLTFTSSCSSLLDCSSRVLIRLFRSSLPTPPFVEIRYSFPKIHVHVDLFNTYHLFLHPYLITWLHPIIYIYIYIHTHTHRTGPGSKKERPNNFSESGRRGDQMGPPCIAGEAHSPISILNPPINLPSLPPSPPPRPRFYYIGTHPPLVAVPSIICSQWGGEVGGDGLGRLQQGPAGREATSIICSCPDHTKLSVRF